ncbi:MAG: hypothetical protein HRU26_02735 [Psychroserpens sp.]|nr:hypothetical protein [Psychroserpens sp.]
MLSIGKYKAILITSLITGIVTFSLFSFHITQNEILLLETFYEVETEAEPEIEELFKDINENNAPSTNKAFNEDEAFREMMRNFKTISPDDFDKTTKALEKEKSENETEDNSNPSVSLKRASKSKKFALKEIESENYRELQDLINKKQNGIAEHAKGNSSLTYSLKGRKLISYDTPRYLCEQSGKIIVNINVNEAGQVMEAYINTVSNSSNQCLHDHAIEYAESIRFNSGTSTNQIGTITFYFKGKR